jgi:hypothetical protein
VHQLGFPLDIHTKPHTHQHNTLVEMQRVMIVSTLPAADMRSQAYGGRGEYAACATTASMAAAAAMSATACCTAPPNKIQHNSVQRNSLTLFSNTCLWSGIQLWLVTHSSTAGRSKILLYDVVVVPSV